MTIDPGVRVSQEPGTAPSSADEFAAWVGPHVAAMSAVASRLAPNADRDDIVQDALLRAWLKRSTYDAERGTARVWLLAITADQARRLRRHLHRRPRLANAPNALIDEVATAQPATEPYAVDVERAIARLSRRQRLAVDLHYFAGLSVAETAAVMRCAEGTVKSTLADARVRLRPLLEESQ